MKDRHRKAQRCGWILTAILCLLCVAEAQVITGTILGTVTDPSGAAVVQATVVVTNQDTGAAVTTQTSNSGDYEAPLLPPGRYSIEVKSAGFQTFQRTSIVLTVDQKFRADFRLAVGKAEETITVAASSQALQTDSSDVNSTISSEQVQNLPNVGRNPMIYMTTVPGVVPRDSAQNSGSVGAMNVDDTARANQSNYSVNGGRPISSDILLDGAADTDSASNAIGITPGLDTIEEVKVITNTYSAEYGRAAGGVINFTTKSGGNTFHGSLFENYAGEQLSANSSANKIYKTPLGDYSLHRFGGTFSGPVFVPKVYKGINKTFFFFAYEGARLNQPQNQIYTVPTDLQRKGDFSQTQQYSTVNGQLQLVPLELFLPFPDTTTVTQVGGGGVQLQRQQVPGANLNNVSQYMSSFGQQFVNVFPEPNHTPLQGDGTQNYLSTAPNVVNTDQITGRLDEQITPDQKLFFRYTSDWTKNLPADPLSTSAPQAVSTPPEKQFNPGATLGYTRTIGSKHVIDVRAAVLRINLTSKAPNVDLTSLGFTAGMAAAASDPTAWPSIGISGYPGQGATWFSLRNNHTTDYSISGSYTTILNKWTLKAGAEYRTFFNNFLQPGVTNFILNSLSGFTQRCAGADCPIISPDHTEGHPIAAAEMALFDGPGFLAWKSPALALRNSYYGFYSQNDWKVTPKLTLNLGLRWDLQPGLTERHNRLTQMDFTAKNGTGTPGVYHFAGINGNPRSNTDIDWNNWGPRVGFAYRYRSDIVLRGGYGISYDQITGVGSGADGFGVDGFEPYNYNTIRPTTGIAAGQDIMNTPFLQSQVSSNDFPTRSQLIPDHYVGGSVKAASRHAPIPRVQMWNLTVENRFPGDILASVGYVGSRGDRLNFQQYLINDTNSIDPSITAAARQQYIATGTDPLSLQVTNPYYGFNSNGSSITTNPTISQAQLSEPYPAYGSINALNIRTGKSWYDSLQATIQSSIYHHTLDIGANYVWSRNEDLGNGYSANAFNSSNAQAYPLYPASQVGRNKSLSASQSPQRVVIYATANLPFGKGKRFLNSTPVLTQIVSGWRISDITSFQSGFPINITGGEGFGNSNGYSRPDLVGDPVLPKKYQAVGDGATCNPLPDGTCIVTPRYTKMYFNPHAYKGRLVTIPSSNGGTQLAPDIYYYGTAPRMTNFYGKGTNLTNLSLSRDISLREGMKVSIRADAANLFNHNMFPTNAISGGFGGTQTNGQAGYVGYSSNPYFGTINLVTQPAVNARNITLQAHFQF